MNENVLSTDGSGLLCVKEVAGLLKCSTRTVYRFADGGLLPRPKKLGALVRWNRAEIESWIEGGCQPVRRPTGKGGAGC